VKSLLKKEEEKEKPGFFSEMLDDVEGLFKDQALKN